MIVLYIVISFLLIGLFYYITLPVKNKSKQDETFYPFPPYPQYGPYYGNKWRYPYYWYYRYPYYEQPYWLYQSNDISPLTWQIVGRLIDFTGKGLVLEKSPYYPLYRARDTVSGISYNIPSYSIVDGQNIVIPDIGRVFQVRMYSWDLV